MKIVKFKGGLGNQLFQYAFLRTLQLEYGCNDVFSDFSFFRNITDDTVRVPRIEQLQVVHRQASAVDLGNVCMFRHDANPNLMKSRIKVFLERKINRKYYYEPDRSVQHVGSLLGYTYFDGYWQSWRYLVGIEQQLRSEFTPKSVLSEKTRKTIESAKTSTSVFVGIRRGDYLATSWAKKHYGHFGQDYFDKAIQIIKEKVSDPVLYVFSNDIPWVKENLTFDCEVRYREDADQTSDIEELFIMSSCKHAIIVNSTFYWWGAWLIDNPDKIIIAPKDWFADGSPIDIVPPNWIKL
jgi:hypothetical protein